MLHEYNPLLRCCRWLLRFRKRRGYGVHSPLAFDFITGVVYNGEPYYAYERLRQSLLASALRLDEYDQQSGLAAKDLRLLFRLANYQEARQMVLVGASPTAAAYVMAARPSAAALLLATPSAATPAPLAEASAAETVAAGPAAEDADARSAAEGADAGSAAEGSDFIYYDAPPAVLPPLPADAMVVVRGIHRGTAAEQAWQRLKDSPQTVLTFDLGRFGILLVRPKMNRQDYVVNYF